MIPSSPVFRSDSLEKRYETVSEPLIRSAPKQAPQVATPAKGVDVCVPFAKDGSFFHPLLRKSRSGEYTVGEKGHELTFDNFDRALAYLKSMPVAKWRRQNYAGNWGIVSAVRWAVLPKIY